MTENLVFPIFPLNGVVLYPKTNLPLNIFEPRYVDMVNFALKNNRLIGMIQTKEDGGLYSVGCLGRISSFDEIEDKRFAINLIGQNYFTISKEIISKKSFRMVEAIINNNLQDSDKNFIISKFKKEILIKKYTDLISSQESNFDISFIEKIEPATLIKFIAMSFPFSSADKQFLLETYNLNELSEKIINLFDFYIQKETNNKLIN